MKWLKDVLSDAKALVLAPLTNILCIGGMILFGAAFVDFDKASGLSLHGLVQPLLAASGGVLVLLGVFLFWRTAGSADLRRSLDYEKGIEIKRGTLVISVKKGKVEDIESASRRDRRRISSALRAA